MGVLLLMMDILYIVLLIVFGIVVGFVNMVVGGGLIFIFLALMLLGMFVDIVNGINCIGVFF